MGYFNKLLGITGFEIQKQKQEGKNIYCYLKQRRKTAVCPNCGEALPELTLRAST